MNRLRHLLLIGSAAGSLAGCIYEAPPPPPRGIYRTVPVERPRPPPPPIIVERPPPPPREHPYWAWQPGHWHWDGYRWVWLRGHYVERLGY